MFYRFPPVTIHEKDATFLVAEDRFFAKRKIESQPGKRTVLLTEYTAIFVVSGTKLLHFPDATISIGNNRLVLLKKGVYVMAEYIESGLEFEALMLFIALKILKELALDLKLTPAPSSTSDPFLNIALDIHLELFKNQILHYFKNGLGDLGKISSLKQKELLQLLLKSASGREVAAFFSSITFTDTEELQYTVQKYILEPLTLSDLANLTNRSLASFKRDFQKVFHEAPRQWINKRKLEHARLLLKNSTLRIPEIADECGFSDVSYFIKRYKNAYGCTPGEIRAKSTTH